MKEIILTSSVMILALIILRALFRSKVSRRLVYGMWLLVALRLLVPVQLGNFQFSILNQTEPVTEAITEVAKNPVAGPSREEVYHQVVTGYISSGQTVFIPEVQIKVEQQLSQGNQSVGEVYQQILEEHKGQDIVLPVVQEQLEADVSHSITAPTLGQIAVTIWIIGMVGMAVWFAGINVSFHRNLKRTAKAIAIPDCPTPVKVDDTLSSPCLFGIVKPTVYLTPGCADNNQIRRHVLTHELTHLHHGDHIWALVRCLCLCVYWFNPLVWVAAGLSKRDCELACDESVIKKLGEDERLAYGKTLVDMVANAFSPRHFLETATAMHETKEQLKERVNCIVKKPKVILAAAICLTLVVAVITGCAFAGNASGEKEMTIEEEIIEAYYDTQVEDSLKDQYTAADLSLRFRGAFSDAYVIFIDGIYLYQAERTSEIVGGIKFEYLETRKLQVYHQGAFYSLQEAYELGLLSANDLYDLKEIYEACGGSKLESRTIKGEVPTTRQPCNHTASPDREITIDEEIRQAYANWIPDANYTSDDLCVRYRGAFNDLYAVFIDGPFGYTTAIRNETIAGVSFDFPDGQILYAYHQGNFYRLAEAYALGLLTETELLTLKKSCAQADHFSQGTIPTDRVTCTHTVIQPDPEFTYSISEASYYPANYHDPVTDGVYVIRSVKELLDFTGLDASKLDPKHNDSFFAENSLIIAAGGDCDTYTVLVENAVMLDDSALHVAFASYVTEVVHSITVPYSTVLEVNRVLEDFQLQYTWQHHVIASEEYNALSPATGPQVSTPAAAPAIPVISELCPKPELRRETLVSTAMNKKFFWQDSLGNISNVQITVPAIVPFCDGAIAINESIRKTCQALIDPLWYAYAENYTPYTLALSYDTYLHDDILTVSVTTEHANDMTQTYIWMLNSSTGKPVTTADLAKQYLGESYPVFLQHRTHDLIEYYKANPWGNADDQAALLKALTYDTFAMHSNTLYLNNDGTLMLTFHVEETDQTFTLPYADMDIYGFEGTNEDAYHWLFHLQTDGAGADTHATLLKMSFFYDPNEFVRMLAKEEESNVSHVASMINYALYPQEEIDSYRALCESIRDLSSNKQHSETAQTLLDAIKPL